jgi:iron complex outermembrane receptor protein
MIRSGFFNDTAKIRGWRFYLAKKRRGGMRIFSKLLLALVCFFTVVGQAAGDNKTDDSALDLGYIIITPTRIGEYESEITSNVTVVEGEKIRSSGSRSVADILKNEVGINIYSAGTPKTIKTDIRGFADTAVSNILVMVDGRKVTPADISGPDWLQIPARSVERIEVLRGAASVLYGDNAVGGVVNIITKKGEGPLSAYAGLMYGSYDTGQGDFELSGSKDCFSYYLYSRLFETDGYRVNSNVESDDISARFGYEFSEYLNVDLSAGWHDDEYGMPGGLNDVGELDRLGRQGSATPADRADTEDIFVRGETQIKIPSDTDFGSLIIDASYRDRKSFAFFDFGIFGTATTLYNIDTFGLLTKYVFNNEAFGQDLNLVAGFDYYDVENKIHGGGSGFGTNMDNLIITKDEYGFYSYGEFEVFSNFYVNGGGRYQRAEYEFDEKAPNARLSEKKPDATAYSAGFKMVYAEGCNIHAGVQRTFRFIATDEWYNTWTGLNTGLNHQKGMQYEAGIRHSIDDTLNLFATPYWIELNNEIFLNPFPAPGINDNYEKTQRKGVEVGGSLDIARLLDLEMLKKLEIFTNYTYQIPKFRGGAFGGNDIPLVPRHQINSGLHVWLPWDLKTTITGSYVGERYAINDTRNMTPKIKDHVVFDARVSYEHENLEFFAGINNIFDKKYSPYVVMSTTSTAKDHYPAPERNYYVGAAAKF